MKIQVVEKCKIPIILVDEVFDSHEKEKIWSEIKFIGLENLQDPSKTKAATTENGEILKSNTGIYLDRLYASRNVSKYLSLYRKIVNGLIAQKEALVKEHVLIDSFFQTNSDTTLLSYYTKGDYYKPHRDLASWTAIYWLFNEPRAWNGGGLEFEQLDFAIPVKSNFCVLFPSFLLHAVEKITAENKVEDYAGRFAFTTFFTLEDV